MGKRPKQERQMAITYSPQADALAVELLPDGRSARMLEILPGIRLDVDTQGRPVSLEILNASQHYDAELLATVGSAEELLTLREAAKECGLDPATLRQHIRRGAIKARKRGYDWLVARHELFNYLERREARGRRPRKKRSPAGAGR